MATEVSQPHPQIYPSKVFPSSRVSIAMASLSKRFLLLVAFILLVVFLSSANPLLSLDKTADKKAEKEVLPAAAKTKVDFVKHIQPIFKQKCVSCHGAEEAEGGLRLDNKKSAFDGGDSGKAFIVGNSAKSSLIHAVSGIDEDTLMPPEDEGTPLTKEQVGLIRAWIDQGAVWPDGVDGDTKIKGAEHWAFQPIANPKLPKIESKWIRNEIDSFILAKLQKEKIAPSTEAPRQVLIRRIYLDLIGLPPSPQEAAKWQKDKRSNWYECLVDELLNSPHYGERWGRLWLDQARYADSDGYEKDNARPNAWRWRDWVIQALNDDYPFDEFTIDQLAGDLRPGASVRQKIATGFQRNTLVNREGGTDPEEDRVKRTVDRTNTLGKVWLGMTVECGQCHTHKYDPLTQREYFQLYAFFNNLSEPNISIESTKENKKYQVALTAYNKKHKKLTQAIEKYKRDKLATAQTAWEKVALTKSTSWKAIRPQSVSASSKTKLNILPDASVLAQGMKPDTDNYTWTAQLKQDRITAIKLEAMPDASLGGKGPGRTKHGNFVLSEFSVTVENANGSQAVKLQAAQADFSQQEWAVAGAIDGNQKTGWAISPQFGKAHTAVFELVEPLTLSDNSKLTIKLNQQFGGQHTIGRFRISTTNSQPPIMLAGIPQSIAKIINTPNKQRTKKQRQDLRKYYTSLDSELKKLQQSAAAYLKKKPKKAATKTQAQAVAELGKPRVTKIHIRGDFLRKGDVVTTATPAIFPPLKPRSKKADRLDLANWLMDPKHPLTARVTVNRIWQQYFGRGIVAIDDDFGTQGEKPSHPLLLDYLATKFRTDGWSFKKLHRLIVTSATYRQSSRTRSELKQRDPYNSWLAYQNRIRVEAETIRDLALSASGLLNKKVGGPSVFPLQPVSVSGLGYASSLRWNTSKGEDRYRRGLYTFFRRTVPYPMLMTFDAPDSNISCTKRDRSNTPLQALTLWNDPVFFECAQHLGTRIVEKVPGQDSKAKTNQARLNYAFLQCFSRAPIKAEEQAILTFYNLQHQIYQADEKLTKQLIGSTKVAKETNRAEVAAWISVARTMMNFDEFITKE